ncbi:lysyl-tRNA synthetase [Diplogelasinospora grovesii]|uniref:Lysyl-tRNA synthetase n=1 Tax=Diplogelasinospora grovesii TaxID=303347 RepID=A0AAN6S3B9_9PEZI|nr:lysyl-tRNA synthetase [Diplogelasinospora grovesii]
MAATTPSLQFLRPYTWRPLLGAAAGGAGKHNNRAAYLRFYHALARQQELAQVDALKYPRLRPPHHNDDVVGMRIPAFREKYANVKAGSVADEEVVVHGRIQSVRRASSKLVFLDIKGEFEHVQGMCNFRKLEESGGATLEGFKKLAKLLNRGDIISVTGRATRTPTGELTVEATRLPELLSPSLVPLPEKLVEDETRIQHRHIDLLVNRRTTDTLRLRSYLIKYLRDFLHERGFLEFQTPILAENAGGAVARPFVTHSADNKELALRIAPELWLKRLVVGGVDRVFELGPAFRKEGIDTTHNPEFYICEFYSAYANLPDLVSLTEDMICGAAQHCQHLISTKLTSLPPVETGKYKRPFRQMEFIPSLEAALGFQLPDLSTDSALEDLVEVLEKNGVQVEKPNPSLPKLLDKLAAQHIEPHSEEGPLFITHHPACMSPLSKSFRCEKTGQLVSARTELFMNGKELANMYEEENDPFAQRQKFIDQVKYREGRQGEKEEDGEMVVDEGYIQALESGLPPTGGWGCGVERLVMLFSGTKRISDVLSFGNLRNVVGLSKAVPVTAATDTTNS